MNDEELKKVLMEMSAKIDAIAVSQKRTQKHARFALWIAVAVFVLPLVGLMFAVPSFLATYETLGNL